MIHSNDRFIKIDRFYFYLFKFRNFPIMKSEYQFIYPVNGDAFAFDYALELAKKSNAKLYILYTYRISDIHLAFHGEKSSAINRKSFDDSIHEKLKEKLELKLIGSKIHYEYLVEIGFLPDRLISNIAEKGIDLVILNNLNHHKDDGLIDRMDELTIPVFIIPNTINRSTPAFKIVS